VSPAVHGWGDTTAGNTHLGGEDFKKWVSGKTQRYPCGGFVWDLNRMPVTRSTKARQVKFDATTPSNFKKSAKKK